MKLSESAKSIAPTCGCRSGCAFGGCDACSGMLDYQRDLERDGFTPTHVCDDLGRAHIHFDPGEACCGRTRTIRPEGLPTESEHDCPHCQHPHTERTAPLFDTEEFNRILQDMQRYRVQTRMLQTPRRVLLNEDAAPVGLGDPLAGRAW